MELVRLTTAGSVDDGKSTLIGRLLVDCNAVFEDQLLAVKKTSARRGMAEIDFSLITDGLAAEREQNITIDVAYRYFSTPKRRFIIADVPGHEQYTRNMVTGASTADIAIILVDARQGLVTQFKRHLFIASMLNIPHVLVVINKMDEVGYAREIYENIKNEIIDFSVRLNIADLQFMPVSALKGDLIVRRGSNMDWYQGSTFFDYLENIQIIGDKNFIDFRFPVQSVLRPTQDFRGYIGQVESGIARKGDSIVVLPSGKGSKIKSIVYDYAEQNETYLHQSALLTLEDDIDAGRGDMIVRENNLPEVSNYFEAMVCWFSTKPLESNRTYILKHATVTVRCFVDVLRYKVDIDSLHRQKTNKLNLNEIGRLYLKTNELLAFDPYYKNRNTGSFILIDELTNDTVGAGIIVNKVRDIVSLKDKKSVIVPKGAVLWFTGLPGSGKTTIADKLAAYLAKLGVECERLDGDEFRKALSKDLGFSKKDRDVNIQRAGFVAGLLSKHKVFVLASFVSPYRAQRENVKRQVDNFVEIFVNAPVEICEERDPKEMYKKTRAGEMKSFTGLDDAYEKPENPDIELHTDEMSVDECVDAIASYLLGNGFLI